MRVRLLLESAWMQFSTQERRCLSSILPWTDFGHTQVVCVRLRDESQHGDGDLGIGVATRMLCNAHLGPGNEDGRPGMHEQAREYLGKSRPTAHHQASRTSPNAHSSLDLNRDWHRWNHHRNGRTNEIPSLSPQ